MRRHGGRPNIDRNSGDFVLQARPNSDNPIALAQRHRHMPIALTQDGLQVAQNMKITRNRAADPVRPLIANRVDKPAQIA